MPPQSAILIWRSQCCHTAGRTCTRLMLEVTVGWCAFTQGASGPRAPTSSVPGGCTSSSASRTVQPIRSTTSPSWTPAVGTPSAHSDGSNWRAPNSNPSDGTWESSISIPVMRCWLPAWLEKRWNGRVRRSMRCEQPATGSTFPRPSWWRPLPACDATTQPEPSAGRRPWSMTSGRLVVTDGQISPSWCD